MDYAENYVHINRFMSTPTFTDLFHMLNLYLLFFLRLMSQMKYFLKHSTVLLIIIAHYWDFRLGKKQTCVHFFITDDLKKRHPQLSMFISFSTSWHTFGI